jgi:hypothetical protein
MPESSLKKPGVRVHSFRKQIVTLILAVSAPSLVACTTLGTPKSIIELSKAEEEYYQNLRPSLRTARSAFERSSVALNKAIVALEENRLIDESLAKRAKVYQALARKLSSPKVSTKEVRKAVDELVRIGQRTEQQLKALNEANEIRRRAILETFIGLDRSLRLIIENKQVIHAHLEGQSAFPPATNFEDAIRWLEENNEMLKEKFELAKEIMEEVRGQFGNKP